MAFSSFTNANLVSEGILNDLALAEQYIALALADSMDVFATPAIAYVGDAAGAGAAVLRSRLIGLGWSLPMTATAAETTDVSASSVTGYYADVTIARRALVLEESQLAQITGGGWGFDPESLGMTMVDSFRSGRMTILGTTIAGATTNVTSTSTAIVDDLYDVIDTFSANGYSGLLVGMLHPTQISQIRDSLRSEVGPMSYRGDVQALRAMGAEELLGIALMPSTKVTTAGGKYEGAVMAAGAIAYGIGSPSAVMTNVQVVRPAGLPVVVDFQVDAPSAKVEIVGNGYDGMAIREAKRIVGLLSNA